MTVDEARQTLRSAVPVEVEGILLVDPYNSAFIGSRYDSHETGSVIRLRDYDEMLEHIMASCGPSVGGTMTIQVPAIVRGEMQVYRLIGDGRVISCHEIEFDDVNGDRVVARRETR